MSKKFSIIIFTDLDGSLLHRDNFKFDEIKDYVKSWNGDKNLVLVTHYVVISEALNYAPSSGEIVIADKNFKKLNSIEINY